MGLNASVAGKRSLPGFQLTCRNSYCTLKIVELKMAAAAGGVPFCVRVFETVVLVGFAAAAAAYGAIWGDANSPTAPPNAAHYSASRALRLLHMNSICRFARQSA